MKTNLILIILCIAVAVRAQLVTTFEGVVKDKDFSAHNIDSAYVKGIDLNTLETKFETFTNENGYYFKQITTTAIDDNTNVPLEFSLSQNFPNPFNPSTKFEFSAPTQGNYTLGIFGITGEQLFSQTFDLNTGNYTFDVSGLGPAGVKFYRIISKDFQETKKMIQLDGTSFNPSVNITSGGTFSAGKVTNLEMRIFASKEGYFKDSSDVSAAPGSTNTQDFLLEQIPYVDTISISIDANLTPTNTPANNSNINSSLFTGITNSNGEYQTNFIVHYVVNPMDSSDKKYTPSAITVNITRNNTTGATQEFEINGSDIIWETDLQQTLIDKNGVATGNVQNEISTPINNANVKVYNNDNSALLGQANTNISGDYQVNYVYQGYENDSGDEHTPINEMKMDFNATNHTPESVVKPFENPTTTNMTLNREAYIFNATIKLHKTFKGQVVSDLDSVFVQWPDGSIDGYINNNGTVNINKELFTLNSDTTAQLFHKHPEQYLNWMVGHRVNPNRPDWMFQNENSTTTSTMPLNAVNSEGTVEVYLVPKYANFGLNNDIPMNMDSTIVGSWFSRNFAEVTGFRPFTFDTTYVFQFTFNLDSGLPIAQNHVDRANNELQKFLTATDWPHKNLLIYEFHQAASINDPLVQYAVSPPRNQDNFTYTTFYSGGGGNVVNIATDGTKRIFNSNSKYNINNSNGQMQEEIFDSMLNTNIDGGTHTMQSNLEYSDLAQNMIGIAYIFKPGTRYKEPVE